MVSRAGVEPARPCGQRILSPGYGTLPGLTKRDESGGTRQAVDKVSLRLVSYPRLATTLVGEVRILLFSGNGKTWYIRLTDNMPGWRNGRRCGLKIRCPKGRAGSTPALGTTRE